MFTCFNVSSRIPISIVTVTDSCCDIVHSLRKKHSESVQLVVKIEQARALHPVNWCPRNLTSYVIVRITVIICSTENVFSNCNLGMYYATAGKVQ